MSDRNISDLLDRVSLSPCLPCSLARSANSVLLRCTCSPTLAPFMFHNGQLSNNRSAYSTESPIGSIPFIQSVLFQVSVMLVLYWCLGCWVWQSLG